MANDDRELADALVRTMTSGTTDLMLGDRNSLGRYARDLGLIPASLVPTEAPAEPADPLSQLTAEERALLDRYPDMRKDFEAELTQTKTAAEQKTTVQQQLEATYAVHDARATLRAAARRIAGTK